MQGRPAFGRIDFFAAEHRIDLSQVTGTGQNGRITKQDVLGYCRRVGASGNVRIMIAGDVHAAALKKAVGAAKEKAFHEKTKYPLRGMHVSVRCTQCHTKMVFSDVGTTCASCHEISPSHETWASCGCPG